MKATYNITQNKINVKFQTGYYPLPGGGGGDLSNYYTKDDTYSKIEINDLLDTIEVKKTELDVLISENKLEPNRLYKITGVESWCFSQHLIKAIYLKAISNNTLESEGVGEFSTPKYNTSDSNLGIWKGELLANGMIDSLSYNIGDKVIWGNLFWKNISGNIGTNEKDYYDEENEEWFFVKSQNLISETDWQLITPNNDESLYNVQFDKIKYDIENDYISYREDRFGNKNELSYEGLISLFPDIFIVDNIDSTFIYYVNSIALFQWGIGNTSNNIINESIVLNCNYKCYSFKDNRILEKSIICYNNFFNVQFYNNNIKKSTISYNYLKNNGGIINNDVEKSRIYNNKYHFYITDNKLKSNSQISNNISDGSVFGNKEATILRNNLDNYSTINSNNFVEEGKGISGYNKGINDNILNNTCNINDNIIKNGSRIFGHTLEYYSTINGNNLDTDSNIYNNQLIQNGKIDNNILTGHGRIYGNQLDRRSEITNCKLRISPTSSYSTTIKDNKLFDGQIQNIDLGNIVNPVGSNPNDPAFGGNELSECIIENNSIIKDLTFPNTGGKYIQFVKMNGFSEFKNITVNDSIRNVDFINTIFNETSDYSKLIEGNGYQTNGFTKTYIDGALLQVRFDEKQDILTEDNVGQFMDLELATKSTPTSGDTVLARDILTNKAVEIPIESLGGGGSGVDTSNLVPYTGANKDVNIASNYFKTSKGFDFTKDADNYFRTYNNGSFNNFVFHSKDNGIDNFGIAKLQISPEEGFVFYKQTDTSGNSFQVTDGSTYSPKKFITDEGFQISGGTATQALTADGGVFDLNTKADLVSGKVPASQLPAYVDDVLEFANLASFPATGESGKIYIAIDTNLTYRWGGSSYVLMSSSLALGETSSTAYRGDRGKIAYDHSQTTGNPHGTTKSDIGLENVDNTSDLNKPISTATQNALNLKADKGLNIKITTPSSWVTGTISETEVLRIEIPANSLSASDVLRIPFLMVNKIGTNGTMSIRGKLSTSPTMPSVTTDQLFQFLALPATNQYVGLDRSFVIDGGQIKGIQFTTNVLSSISNSNSQFSFKSFDRTVTNYLYVSITLANTADKARLEGLQLTNS